LKSAPEIATSMQLGGWIRARFVREGTGQVPAMPFTGAAPAPGPGTQQMSPGTLAAPGTAAGRPITQMPVTPPVFPPRRVVKKLTDTGDGTEIYTTTSDLDEEAAETIRGARPRMGSTTSGTLSNEPARATNPRPSVELPPPRMRRASERPRPATRPPSELAQDGARPALPHMGTPSKSRPTRLDDPTNISRPDPDVLRAHLAADEPTLHAPPPLRGDPTDVSRPAPDEEDSENHFETILRDVRAPEPSRPSVLPTRVQPAIGAVSESSARPPVSDSAARALVPDAAARAAGSGARGAIAGEQRRPHTPLPAELQRRKRKKLLVAIGGLGGLTIASFLIALAASSGGRGKSAAAVPQDATPLMVRPDAALPIAPPPLDAALIPTVPIDAASSVDTDRDRP
jgi:hypothetical protein